MDDFNQNQEEVSKAQGGVKNAASKGYNVSKTAGKYGDKAIKKIKAKKAAKKAGEEAGKKASKEASKKLGKAVIKKAGKEAAKTAGKSAVKSIASKMLSAAGSAFFGIGLIIPFLLFFLYYALCAPLLVGSGSNETDLDKYILSTQEIARNRIAFALGPKYTKYVKNADELIVTYLKEKEGIDESAGNVFEEFNEWIQRTVSTIGSSWDGSWKATVCYDESCNITAKFDYSFEDITNITAAYVLAVNSTLAPYTWEQLGYEESPIELVEKECTDADYFEGALHSGECKASREKNKYVKSPVYKHCDGTSNDAGHPECSGYSGQMLLQQTYLDHYEYVENKNAKGYYTGESDNNEFVNIQSERFLSEVMKYADNMLVVDDDFSQWYNNIDPNGTFYVMKEIRNKCDAQDAESQKHDECKGGYSGPADDRTYLAGYEKVEKHGPVGTITIPIRYDMSSYKADEIASAAKFLQQNDNLGELEAYEKLNTLITNYFLQHCEYLGFTADSNFFINTSPSGVSAKLIGIGSNGYNGTLLKDVNFAYSKYVYNGDPFDENVLSYVWGHVQENLQKMGYSLNYQCTEFVVSRAYDQYGLAIPLVNGINMAEAAVNAFPDKFTLSRTPAPGAIASTLNFGSPGHTMFIEEVQEDYIVVSDGNIMYGGKSAGLRILRQYSYSEFYQSFGSCIYAVPISK